jgi:hypothetical protein
VLGEGGKVTVGYREALMWTPVCYATPQVTRPEQGAEQKALFGKKDPRKMTMDVVGELRKKCIRGWEQGCRNWSKAHVTLRYHRRSTDGMGRKVAHGHDVITLTHAKL